MFKSKPIHDSLLILLKGAVKDNRFIDDSKIFGKDWIAKTIIAAPTKDALKDLVCETFKRDARVTKVAVDICKYFVSQPETKELTK